MVLETKYELIESARRGPGPEDGRPARVLNRVVCWTESGLEYEADPRQAEQLIRDVGFVGAKSLGTWLQSQLGAACSRQQSLF